jgi:uncharacterized protein (TIGR01244 family)
MSDIRHVTQHFSVAPQITPDEVGAAAAQGFRMIINNRPDGEAPDQPTNSQMKAAAEKAGLSYIHIPIVGRPTPDLAWAVHEATLTVDGPVLAFCRSGTRSITAWAMGEAASGAKSPDELVKLAAAAGYDLRPVLQG